MHIWRFEAIGTRWEVATAHAVPADRRRAVTELIAAFDAAWSRFRPDSLVSSLRDGGRVPAPPDAAAMFSVYAELGRATAGAVTPLIGAALEALGYDSELSLRAGRPEPAPAHWERMLRWDDAALTLAGPALIDVGAVGKGRLVDLVLAALGPLPGRVTVDASGDLRVRGGAIRVALEHPYDPAMAVGVVPVADAALCASAGNRRAWADGMHHVLDGRTGLPVRTWAATWALAADAMHADAAATALFFDGGRDLAAQWDVQWVRMATDGRIERSPGFPGELFTR